MCPYSNAGLVEAVALYWRAVETCNALNGFPGAQDPALNVPTQK